MSILLLHDEAAGPSSPAPVSAGLQALYQFADGAGQVLADSSGQGRNGVLGSTAGADTNDPLWVAEGLSFTTDDYAECGTDAALRPDALTVCAAVKLTTSAVVPIVGWGATAQYPAIYAGAPFNANRPVIWLGNNCYRYFEKSSPTNLQDGGWHFLVFSVPGNTSADIVNGQLTVDGIAQTINSTQTTSEGAAKTQCRIGRAGSATFAEGSMALLSIHDRVLSIAEMEQMRTYATATLAGRVTLP
jgi:hypothetical protein